PGPSSIVRPPRASTTTVPSSITNMPLPGSSGRARTCPSGTLSSAAMEAIRSCTSASSSAKSGIARSLSVRGEDTGPLAGAALHGTVMHRIVFHRAVLHRVVLHRAVVHRAVAVRAAHLHRGRAARIDEPGNAPRSGRDPDPDGNEGDRDRPGQPLPEREHLLQEDDRRDERHPEDAHHPECEQDQHQAEAAADAVGAVLDPYPERAQPSLTPAG